MFRFPTRAGGCPITSSMMYSQLTSVAFQAGLFAHLGFSWITGGATLVSVLVLSAVFLAKP
jgi:hypothetical protein